jgi:hypothetical protein
MTLRTCGFCAPLVPEVAAKAIQRAGSEIDKKEGLVVASSADLFLGAMGAVSREYAETVFPILTRSATSVMKNEPDWIIEAFAALVENLAEAEVTFVAEFAGRYAASPRKSTKLRAEKLLKRIGRS